MGGRECGRIKRESGRLLEYGRRRIGPELWRVFGAFDVEADSFCSAGGEGSENRKEYLRSLAGSRARRRGRFRIVRRERKRKAGGGSADRRPGVGLGASRSRIARQLITES